MSEPTHILSTLTPDEPDDEGRRRRHAATQRRYRAALKRAHAPESEDLGRALLAAMRACLEPGVSEADAAAWERLIEHAVDELEGRGFDRAEVRQRLLRALVPRR